MPAEARTSKYLILALTTVILLLGSISSTAVAVAFPAIQSTFSASIIMAGWVLSISQLVFIIVQPLAGKASDIFGRKVVFLICLGLFTIGSLLSALAPSIELLIFFRFIQAVGAGAFYPSIMGIVADTFPEKRQQMIGLIGALFPIGQVIGPIVGGWLTDAYSWRYVFLFNIPFCVLGLIMGAVLLRQTRRKSDAKLDLIGAGLLAAVMSSFMIGLSILGRVESSADWVIFGVFMAACGAALVLFLKRENRVKYPVIDLQLLKEKAFVGANVYTFLYGTCIMGVATLIPLYTVSIYGKSVLESGLILTPKSIVMAATSGVASFFLVRWGYRWPMLIGSTAISGSLFLLGLEPGANQVAGMNLSSTAILIMMLCLMGFGSGLAAPAANNACIELMPDRVGTIAGIRGMFRMSGGAIGVNAATLILYTVGDVYLGFSIIFIGSAFLMLLAIPMVFIMPRGPEDKNAAISIKNLAG